MIDFDIKAHGVPGHWSQERHSLLPSGRPADEPLPAGLVVALHAQPAHRPEGAALSHRGTGTANDDGFRVVTSRWAVRSPPVQGSLPL